MAAKKFRVNILDFVIFAAVFLCIAGVFLRSGKKNTDEKLETQTVVISFSISNVQAASADCFRDGDLVYSESLGCSMGRIIGDSIAATPAVLYIEDKGSVVEVVSGLNRVDIRGSFVSEGKMSESGFLIGGTQYVAPGMTTLVYLPNINVNILITDVELQ